jgi:hypothetical protein
VKHYFLGDPVNKFDKIFEELIAALDFLIDGFIILYNDILGFIFTVTVKTNKGEATIPRLDYYRARLTASWYTLRWRVARIVIGKKLLTNTADLCPYCHETLFVFNEGKYATGQLPLKPRSKEDMPAYGLVSNAFRDMELGLLIVRAASEERIRDLWVISKKDLVLSKDMVWINRTELKEEIDIANTIFTTLELQNILNVMRSKKC